MSSPRFITLSMIVSASGPVASVGIMPLAAVADRRTRVSAAASPLARRRRHCAVAAPARQRRAYAAATDRPNMKPTSWIGVSSPPMRSSDAPSAQSAYGPRGARSAAAHSAPGQNPDVHPPLKRSRPSSPSPSGKRPRAVRDRRSPRRWSSSASRRAVGVTVSAVSERHAVSAS